MPSLRDLGRRFIDYCYQNVIPTGFYTKPKVVFGLLKLKTRQNFLFEHRFREWFLKKLILF